LLEYLRLHSPVDIRGIAVVKYDLLASGLTTAVYISQIMHIHFPEEFPSLGFAAARGSRATRPTHVSRDPHVARVTALVSALVIEPRVFDFQAAYGDYSIDHFLNNQAYEYHVDEVRRQAEAMFWSDVVVKKPLTIVLQQTTAVIPAKNVEECGICLESVDTSFVRNALKEH